jgi:hypothetical protein
MRISYLELTRLSVALLATLGLTTLPPVSAVAQDSASKVFAPNSNALGKKFKDWSAEWWQFVLSIPAAENPLVDETGDKCSIGQRGPVWFLFGGCGGTIRRACSIPEGTALFFPIINHVDINLSNQTAAELRAEIAPDSVTTLSVEVDGIPLDKLDKSRVRSSVFAITAPPGGFLDPDPGPGTYSPVVDDGFYVMLRPLAVGNHTLHFHAEQAGVTDYPFCPEPFSIDVSYNLTVVPVALK